MGLAPIVLGVCVMEKKLKSIKPLLTLLGGKGDFTIVCFSESTLLGLPVEAWPMVEVLISFHSEGFPLDKSQEYVKLRNPICFNNPSMQSILLDRRRVYETLVECGVPTPSYAVFDHLDPDNAGKLVVHEEFIEVHGKRIQKPLVEKPVSAEDHNINIYYPDSVGGGCKMLFRKVGDQSSAFDPERGFLRDDGCYLYEEFLPTEGTDVKVYTIGPQYAYAEARKAPSLDGRVIRDEKGKELRYPVLLSAAEKHMARAIVLGFGQAVCGFDLLRAHGKSYVCDVNGWSFVKTSSSYYLDAAQVLRKMALISCRRNTFDATPPTSPMLLDDKKPCHNPLPVEGVPPLPHSMAMESQKPELLAAVAVIRHADRTPKQKLKFECRNPRLLDYFLKHGLISKPEIKLKRPRQLQQVLDLVSELLSDFETRCAPGSDAGSDADIDGVGLAQMRQLRQVLKAKQFSGINRKLQVKRGPLDEGGTVREALLVMKWGGELTQAGLQQAELLGRNIRQAVSALEDGDDLLHLHSTYRHDLKFYSSDEGRVQVTAAAAAKGMLELEGELPPILVSLVRKDAAANEMLDDTSAVSDLAQEVKSALHARMQQDVDAADPELQREMLGANPTPALLRALLATGNPLERVRLVGTTIVSLCAELFDLAQAAGGDTPLYHGESLFMMLHRWRKLQRDVFSRKTSLYDISKVPDIYDCIKYDCTHNADKLLELSADNGVAALLLPTLHNLYRLVQPLAQLVVPLEYGIGEDAVRLGAGVMYQLLRKLMMDLSFGSLRQHLEDHHETLGQSETVHRLDPRHASYSGDSRHQKTRLYFTSESHIYTFLNLIRWAPEVIGVPPLTTEEGRQHLANVSELSYLTHIAFLVFEHKQYPPESPERYQVRIRLGAGDTSGLGIGALKERTKESLPLQPSVWLHDSVPLIQVLDFVERVCQLRNEMLKPTPAHGERAYIWPSLRSSGEAAQPIQAIPTADTDTPIGSPRAAAAEADDGDGDGASERIDEDSSRPTTWAPPLKMPYSLDSDLDQLDNFHADVAAASTRRRPTSLSRSSDTAADRTY